MSHDTLDPIPPPVGGSHRHAVHALVTTLKVAPRQEHAALTLWPLVQEPGLASPIPPCVPLAHALARGEVTIDEIHASGAVPHVRISPRGPQPVLVLFGEELVGARQNRVANATFLVPPGDDLVLDVSCVEAGRWGRRPGERFGDGEQVISHALRRKMSRQVARARAAGAGFHADQGEVWNEIARRIRSTETESRTSAYCDYTASLEGDLRDMAESFHRVPHQVGFVAAIDGRIAGIETVGSPWLFEQLFPRLLRAHAVDAVSAALRSGRPGVGDRVSSGTDAHAPWPVRRFDTPEAFLVALGRADCSVGSSLGLGYDLRLSSVGLSACALDVDGIVHLTGFVDPD